MTSLPRIIRPGEGRETELPGERLTGLFTGRDTDGQLAVAEYELVAEYGTTEHRHHRSGGFFYVLAGPVLFEIDGVEHHAPTGSAVWVPAGAAHRLSNLGATPVRILGAFAPSGPEMLFQGMVELYERTQGQPTTTSARS